MAIKRGPSVVKDGLVLCLDAADKNSYPGTGTSWEDVSAESKLNLDTSLVTFENNTFKATALNEYIWFGGTNPSLENLTADGNSHTFECWWMPLGTPPGTNSGLFCGRRGFHSGHGQSKSNGLSHFSFVWFSDNTGNSVGSPYVYPGYGVWGHLCYVVDEVNNLARYYANGIQRGSALSITKALRNYGTSNYHFFSGGGTDFSGNGRLGAVRFYNKALSASEILQNYNATKSRFGL